MNLLGPPLRSITGSASRAVSAVAVGFADLWAQEQHGMSDRWRGRAAHHWEQYMRSHVQAAVNRRDNASRGVPSTWTCAIQRIHATHIRRPVACVGGGCAAICFPSTVHRRGITA
ncbi:hypothetical protein [Streptomyces sp. NPDC006739]|uniref:terpene synthase family protein n=1 Tax=Streptomyces sp. NPDC006739 TaxID=3364763 RepID=UPI0036B886F1